MNQFLKLYKDILNEFKGVYNNKLKNIFNIFFIYYYENYFGIEKAIYKYFDDFCKNHDFNNKILPDYKKRNKIYQFWTKDRIKIKKRIIKVGEIRNDLIEHGKYRLNLWGNTPLPNNSWELKEIRRLNKQEIKLNKQFKTLYIKNLNLIFKGIMDNSTTNKL